MALFNKDWSTYKTNWENARGIGGKIGSIFASSNVGTSTSAISKNQMQILRNWNNAVKHGCTNQETFNKIIASADEITKMYFNGLNRGKGSVDGLKNAQDAAKQSTNGLAIAQKALNIAIDMGTGLLISFALKGISKVINYQQDLINESEKTISVFENSRDSLNNNKQTIDDISSDYAKLSQGVDTLGKNVSLNTEEYSRYNEIVNKIADMFPQMVQGYTDEGNAIIANKGNVEALTKSYQEQKKAYQDLVITKSSEVFNGYKVKVAETPSSEKLKGKRGTYAYYEQKKYIDELIESLEDGQEAFEDFYNNQYIGNSDIYNVLYSATNTAGIDWGGIMNIDERYEQIKTQMTKLYAYQRQLVSNINTETAKIKPIMSAYLEQSYDYQSLDSDVQDVVSQIVGQFDSQFYTQFDNETDMASWITENIVNKFKGVDGKMIADAFKSAIDLKTKLQNSEISFDEYLSGINEFKTLIDGFDNNTKKSIELIFNVNSSDGLSTDALVNNVKDKLQNKFDDKVGALTLGELEIAANLEVPEGVLLTWDELVAKIKKVYSSTSRDKTSILFTDTISQVQSLSNGLDQLDKIYADVLDKESFDWSSVLNNKEFIETFGGLGAVYDDFIKTISNSPNDINACQSAFNELTTAYIQNGDALSGLTEETKQVSIAMLEEMGIKNAEEVVTSVLAQKVDELAAKKILAANSTYTLSDLTVEEINSLLAEGVIAEQTAQRLAIFALQKQLSNNYRIETQEDVNRIYSLAQMAGIGAEALAKFAQFKNNLENETDPRTRSYIIKSINEYKSTLFSEIEGVKNSKIEIPEVSYGGGSATKNAIDQSNKAAEDNKAKFKEILDKYLELYKAELDAGLIDFETFLNKSRSLLDEYYRDGKISGKEYWDYIGNLQKEQLSVYDKVLSAVTKRYDDEIDKINDIIDGLEKQNDALNDQLDQYDNVLGVVDKVYESEIDRIQEQQDAIDETISKLQDENDEKQRAIELEKARYQLYRALNNRTVKLYNGKEYIYTHNRDEVRDAQQNLADLELEETVAGLEKEKEALDDVIEELEKYREMWQEISSAKEDEEYKQLAIAIWGKDYEKIILSNRITDIEAFKDKYIHLQQQIEDNQGLIDSYNEKIEYYEALKEAWNAVATEREEAINREIAAQVLGANWENDILNGRMDVLNNFKNMYIATQQAIVDAAWNAANAQIAALNAVKAAESTKSPTSGGSSGSVSSSASNKPNKPNKKPSHSNSGGGNSNRPSMEKYGTGTNNAKPGTHIVAENGKEIIRTNDGEMLLAEHKQPFKFAGGETVISNSETTELLNNLGNYKPVEFVELTGTDGNKFKIRPEDIMKRWERDLTTLFPLPPNYINTTAYDNAPVRNNNTTSINIGDIHLHEVQNVDGLAKAIIRELPGKVAQAMYRK